MSIDYTDASAIAFMLQEVYGEGMTNQFADETLTYHQFPKSDRQPRGEGYVFATKYARSQSVGARIESAPCRIPWFPRVCRAPSRRATFTAPCA